MMAYTSLKIEVANLRLVLRHLNSLNLQVTPNRNSDHIYDYVLTSSITTLIKKKAIRYKKQLKKTQAKLSHLLSVQVVKKTRSFNKLDEHPLKPALALYIFQISRHSLSRARARSGNYNFRLNVFSNYSIFCNFLEDFTIIISYQCCK